MSEHQSFDFQNGICDVHLLGERQEIQSHQHCLDFHLLILALLLRPLLRHYGMTESRFFSIQFAVSIGIDMRVLDHGVS
jgi:hypothetical protein